MGLLYKQEYLGAPTDSDSPVFNTRLEAFSTMMGKWTELEELRGGLHGPSLEEAQISLTYLWLEPSHMSTATRESGKCPGKKEEQILVDSHQITAGLACCTF